MGKRKKEHRRKVEKRNKEIRQAQMKRVNTLTNNISTLQQVLLDYANERVQSNPKEDSSSK